MLVELVVRDLGVIAEAGLTLDPGMTALTGETGAGKTMLVEALHLLSGGRPDPSRVRQGAEQAVVEGLFVVGDTEWVLRRVVPASGRSRSYLNGELCTSATLTEIAQGLLEIHGQHAQQALLQPRRQREALDRGAGVDLAPLEQARTLMRSLNAALEELGGDERTRSRHIDLLGHQIAEIAAVSPRPGEEDDLVAEEELLAGALEHRKAGEAALSLLAEEGAAVDLLATTAARLANREPFADITARLNAAHAELADCASELRAVTERIEPDEERLEEIGRRRQALSELRRKYGNDAPEILAFAEKAGSQLEELLAMHERREELAERLAEAHSELARAAEMVGQARRAAAGPLGSRVGALLEALALRGARVEVSVEDSPELPGAGSRVELLFTSDPGSPAHSLSRVASGGELSRVMLALRLVLSGGPPTMVFDEVDAGVGGEAALSVGRALAELALEHQVLVVTHLPQVAAHAGSQFVVSKNTEGTVATTTVGRVDAAERVVELSRMLSGSPRSDKAREHAAELLDSAGGLRSARRGP